jgi:hypothetical protein
MIFKPCSYFETGGAAYLFGCGGLGTRVNQGREEPRA